MSSEGQAAHNDVPVSAAKSESASGGHGAPRQMVDLPDLRLLPVASLIPHEYADQKRVDRLVNRISADGFLKNPPIVAPIPDSEQFVVLDGANRTAALERIGAPHVVAQVVDYKSDQVELLTWHHLITGREPSNFLQEIAKVPGLVLYPVSLDLARQALSARAILAYIVLPIPSSGNNYSVFTVDGTPGTDHHGTRTSTALLNAMVDTYKGDPQVTIHRVSTDELDDLMNYYDGVSGLIVFPPYTPDDIIALAVSGSKVPTGITRHIISHRALRVNIPLTLLESPEPLDKKNAWWHEQVKRKLASNEIRLYQESTYLFDE
jgi:L-serine kinase (ATP) / ParB family transcriptional regulator, heme-responsive regulator